MTDSRDDLRQTATRALNRAQAIETRLQGVLGRVRKGRVRPQDGPMLEVMGVEIEEAGDMLREATRVAERIEVLMDEIEGEMKGPGA